MTTISHHELSDLLTETGGAHHTAYHTSDGVDPEWASWYGPYLQCRLGDRLGRGVTRSELIYLLVRADREQTATGDGSAWQDYYATVILAG